MNFSKTTSYAISVLNYMTKDPDTCFSARTLNQILNIPWQYLRQLLNTLSKKGFITSIQGRNGGFVLAKAPDEITLASIVEAIDGLEIFTTCIMGFDVCPFDKKCVMHNTWEEARSGIVNILRTTTLDKFRDN